MMSSVSDRRSRPLRDLRISVTARCNFRCTYGMPKEIFGRNFAFLPRGQLLTFEEITRLARTFAREGVSKIRLTGGDRAPRHQARQRDGRRDSHTARTAAVAELVGRYRRASPPPDHKSQRHVGVGPLFHGRTPLPRPDRAARAIQQCAPPSWSPVVLAS